MAKKQFLEAGFVVSRAQQRQAGGRAAFFHDDGRQMHVHGSGVHERVEDRAEMLGGHVVDVALEEPGLAAIGAGRGRLHPRQVHAQEVWQLGLAVADAVAGFFHDHGRTGRETRGQAGQDGGAGRGGGFLVHGAPGGGEAVQEFLGGRGRHRKQAMGAADKAASEFDRRGPDRIHAEKVAADGRAHDIDDGVDGPDFVEMDRLHRDAVDLGLGRGDAAKDGQTRAAHGRIQAACLDEAFNGGQIAPVVAVPVPRAVCVAVLLRGSRRFGQDHVHPGAANAVSGLAADAQFEGVVQAELGKLATQDRRVHAQVDQGGQIHVAAYARGAVVKKYPHEGPSGMCKGGGEKPPAAKGLLPFGNPKGFRP